MLKENLKVVCACVDVAVKIFVDTVFMCECFSAGPCLLYIL